MPEAQKEIYLKDGVTGVRQFVAEQLKKLDAYAYIEDNGEKVVDIIAALRDSINNNKPEIEKAIKSIYNKMELDEITKDRIIKPENWREKWLVWSEEMSSKLNVQRVADGSIKALGESGAKLKNLEQFKSMLSRLIEIGNDFKVDTDAEAAG